MNQYAQSMLDMLGQVGKPIVSKSTSTSTGTSNQTQSANEGLDIGSLMMMLMMMLGNKKKATPGLDAGDEAANAYQYLAPAKTQVTPVESSAALPFGQGREAAGTGNASPDLADALSGIVLSSYMNRNPNMTSPGSQLSTGSNPMARMTPAQLLQLMMG